MNHAENKKKLFSSGGIFVDLFIGFLIAACIAGVVYRCFIYDPYAHEQSEGAYQVYFEIMDEQPGFAAYFEEGDKVYANGVLIGTVPASRELIEESETSEEQSSQEQVTEEQGHTLSFYSNSDSLDKGTLLTCEQGTLVIRYNEKTIMLTPGQILEIYTDTACVNVRVVRIAAETEE